MTQELEDRLAAAVHLLTETQTEAVSAYDDDGKFVGMHMLEHDALIDKLITAQATHQSRRKRIRCTNRRRSNDHSRPHQPDAR